MGDGRYYTFRQFFFVSFLLIQLIVMIVLFVQGYYKLRHQRKSFMRLSVLLMTVTTLSIYEQVTIMDGLWLNRMSVGIIVYSVMIYLFNFIWQKHHLVLEGLVFLILVLLLPMSIVKYDYFAVTYASFMKYIVLGLGLIACITLIFQKTHQPWIMLPIILGLYECISVPNYSHLLMYLTSGLMVMYALLILKQLTVKQLKSKLFHKIEHLIKDYVIITNNHHEIVYANKPYQLSDWFQQHPIVEKSITSVFVDPVKEIQAYQQQWLYLMKANRYFIYQSKKIEHQNHITGYLHTLIDMTSLYELLETLKQQEEETKKVNQQLQRYKGLVYELEKEKEIQILTEEIMSNQQAAMLMIKEKLGEINDTSDLSQIILEAKDNLRDVRKAVTTYMNYYE